MSDLDLARIEKLTKRVKLLEENLTSLACVCSTSDGYDANFEGLEHETLKTAIKALIDDPNYNTELLEDSMYLDIVIHGATNEK